MSAAKDSLEANVLTKNSVKPVLNRSVDFLSSVRFGVVLLMILVVLSIIGMVIIQQNVQGFDSYFASLTPAERTVYGGLGLFDIYHSWYYNVLLLILSLNIILASISLVLVIGVWSQTTSDAPIDWAVYSVGDHKLSVNFPKLPIRFSQADPCNEKLTEHLASLFGSLL